MPRPAPTLILLCASCLVVRTAHAQTPYAPASNSSIVHVSDQPTADYGALVAQVVFVGIVENAARLANEISGLLSAHGITPHFEQRSILREDELVAQQQSGDSSHGTVWILFPSPTAARLVFADHAHQRFLIRDIPLPEGLDDVARESIGQIVESSLLALLQGTTALGRTEVHKAMGQFVDATPVEPPPPVAAVAAPKALAPTQPDPSPLAQPNPPAQTRRWLTQRFGIGYGANFTGSAFGLEHGPGPVAGAELIRRQDSLFATAAFDWHFTQHYQTSEFDLSIQSSRIWLLFGWRKPIDDTASFVATLGPGLSVTRVSSTPSETGPAGPGSISHDVAPWARIQSGLEWGNSPLVIQLLLMADASFYNTQYDIYRNGTKEPLAHPWFVRPGAALGAVWR